MRLKTADIIKATHDIIDSYLASEGLRLRDIVELGFNPKSTYADKAIDEWVCTVNLPGEISELFPEDAYGWLDVMSEAMIDTPVGYTLDLKSVSPEWYDDGVVFGTLVSFIYGEV